MERCCLNEISLNGLGLGGRDPLAPAPFTHPGRFERPSCWELLEAAAQSPEAFAELVARCAAHDAQHPEYTWSQPVSYDWLLLLRQQRHPAAGCPELPPLREDSVVTAVVDESRRQWGNRTLSSVQEWRRRIDAAREYARAALVAGRGGDPDGVCRDAVAEICRP